VLGFNSAGGVAGEFQGNVRIFGNLNVTGSKSSVVTLPDQRNVTLYAVESPENWFEDFGSGKLVNGVARIVFEPTFAQTVNTKNDYHVFLTPDADCKGLYVAQKTANGFEVRELRGGRSNISFEYRLVARRKGYEDLRLQQLSLNPSVVDLSRPTTPSSQNPNR
jgi:hypothetical protein